MKKLMLIAMLTPAILHAQWHANLFGGFSNYFGELQDKPFTVDQSKVAFGLGLQYDLTPHFSVLSGLNYGSVGGADAFNKPSLQPRNLSFQTKIFEFNAIGEYTLLDLETNVVSPYVFAGLALYHFNPYAYDSLGRKIYLKPLSTEGEGLAQYPESKPYHLIQMAIPFGGGIKFRVSEKITLAYEIGFRKLFTDHLDDVSTTYIDPAILLAAKGPTAVEMSYRGGELKGGNPTYPGLRSLRGNVKNQDWYYFSGIKISIAFDSPTGKRRGTGRYGSVIDCPKKVN